MRGFPEYLTHSLKKGSDAFFGTAKFWTCRPVASIPVYSMKGLSPGRIVAEPDQQLLISAGWEGQRA